MLRWLRSRFFSAAVAAQDAPGASRVLLRIGMLEFERQTTLSDAFDSVLDKMIAYLGKRFPEADFEVRYHSFEQLMQAVQQAQVDFTLTSSGVYVAMQPYGVQAIATVTSPLLPDPNTVAAGAMFVRADRSDLRHIGDLKSKRAVSTHPLNFMTYQINMAEIARRGHNPERFFRHAQFVENDPLEVVQRVFDGRADVGLLRACMLEDVIERYALFAQAFRVIDVQSDEKSPCQASTRGYPGWTMALTPHALPEDARMLAAALLEMAASETEEGYQWSIATDFESVNWALRTLRVQPYAYLREWKVADLWASTWPFVCFGIGLLLAGLVHLHRVKALVAQRTQHLMQALARERQADARASRTVTKLEKLMRVSAVGQLSSIFVHELGQPLAAMSYSLHGLQTLASRIRSGVQTRQEAQQMHACLEMLREQLAQCTAIMNQVRGYAKSPSGRNQRVNLTAVVAETMVEICEARKAHANLQVQLPQEHLYVMGNAVEIKLALMNLIRNANEEIRANPHKEVWYRVTLKADSSAQWAELTVENSGRKLTEADVEHIQEPFISTRADGLGLGTMIVASIAEAHCGDVRYSARAAGGLIARIRLPLCEAPQPEESETP